MAATHTKPWSSTTYNPNLTRGASATTKGTSHFFKKLEKLAKEKANEVIETQSSIMYNTMRYRRTMLGEPNSRYPKWDGSNGVKSKKSYTKWVMSKNPNGSITLHNSAVAPISNFSYPLLLLNGPQGSYRWGKPSKGLFGKVNSMGFSTQMPNGIHPWLKRYSIIIKNELKKEIGKIA